MALQLFLKLCRLTQNHRGKLLGASCLGLFTANMSYHVFPEQTFRQLYQIWPKGEPARLSDGLLSLFQDVLAETHLGPPTGYTPFAAYGFAPVSAGAPWLPGGCLIGIPANYNDDAEDAAGTVNRPLVIKGKEVDLDWSSDIGKQLRDSLTLSSDAKKFSLAREAVHAQASGPIVQASVAPVCFATVCVSSVGFKQLLGLYSSHLIIRGIFSLLAVTIGFIFYFLVVHSVAQWLDYRADRKAASVSKFYAQGGLEFYEKILARNRILRGIMGKQGQAMYAPSGNLFPKEKLRLKHTPYTWRRDHIRRILETMWS